MGNESGGTEAWGGAVLLCLLRIILALSRELSLHRGKRVERERAVALEEKGRLAGTKGWKVSP